MGLSDRFRAWMRGDSKRGSRAAAAQPASRGAARDLEAFAASRAGVEGYLEPKTAIYSTTVLLVADDGEYLRRPVASRDAARELCTRLNVPLYDAAKVGYPKRMREYDRGVRPRRVDLSELPPWPGDDAGGSPPDDGPPPPPRQA